MLTSNPRVRTAGLNAWLLRSLAQHLARATYCALDLASDTYHHLASPYKQYQYEYEQRATASPNNKLTRLRRLFSSVLMNAVFCVQALLSNMSHGSIARQPPGRIGKWAATNIPIDNRSAKYLVTRSTGMNNNHSSATSNSICVSTTGRGGGSNARTSFLVLPSSSSASRVCQINPAASLPNL